MEASCKRLAANRSRAAVPSGEPLVQPSEILSDNGVLKTNHYRCAGPLQLGATAAPIFPPCSGRGSATPCGLHCEIGSPISPPTCTTAEWPHRPRETATRIVANCCGGAGCFRASILKETS
jgi:hypothetical protein